MTWKLLGLIIAAGIAFNGAILLAWIAWCHIARAWDRRKRARASTRPAPLRQCPCGCGRTRRSEPAPAAPHDGRPLDGYEQAKWASVLLDLIASPDDDSADVREDHQ